MSSAAAPPNSAPVPPVNLAIQYARIKADVDRRIADVLAHGRFILGPEVQEFEAEIAKFCGASHAIGVSSGYDALVIALWACDVGPGNAVFIPSFTFSATAGAVITAGATPVFVDVDPHTFLMSPSDLERALDRVLAAGELRPRAVMPVDLFGLAADYPAITDIAEQNGMSVIADAAQSMGGSRGGKSVGAMAPLTATSFFPTKPLGAFGDGGCVFTDDPAIAQLCRSIRVHGQEHDDEQHRKGMTGRLDTMQAAVLLAKLAVFPDELAARERVATAYDEGLADLGDAARPPARIPGARSAWAQYTMQSDRRDSMERLLNQSGIMARVYYRKGVHLQEAFRRYSPYHGPLPATEQLSEQVFSLPLHPYLSDQEIDRVIETTRRAARS